MKVGSLVECINDKFDFSRASIVLHTHLPVKNKIYTVRSIFKGSIEGTGIHLEEIKSKINPVVGMEQGFNIDRFRELLPPISINISEIIHEHA